MAVFSHKARGPRTHIPQGPKMNVYDLGNIKETIINGEAL